MDQFENLGQKKLQPVSPLAVQLLTFKDLYGEEARRFCELLEGIFESLDQGIIVIGIGGQLIVYNSKAKTILGYSAGEILAHTPLWDKKNKKLNLTGFIEKSGFEGQKGPEKARFKVKHSQKSVPTEIKPILGRDGAVIGLLGIIQSFLPAREAEADTKSQVRLASIGRIITSIAHEINNPLQTVRTSLELALDNSRRPARRREYFKTADQEISRIAQIINLMRSFYRPSPGVKQAVSLNEKLQAAVLLLNPSFQAARVELHFELSSALPLFDFIDYQLEQIFLGLMTLVLETMRERGRLDVRSWKEDSTRVGISFRASNPQLESYQIERLLGSLQIPAGGSQDLRLSVSREIINELGGWVETSFENEFKLTIYLPI